MKLLTHNSKGFYYHIKPHFILYLLGSLLCLGFMVYNFLVQPLPFSYDGKSYFLVALNPFVKNPEVSFIRYFRILLPLLAFSLSEITLKFYYIERQIVTMIWIWIFNIGFYLWSCRTIRKLFNEYSSPLLSFGLVALNPILLIATINGLTDPAFYACIFGLLDAIRKDNNSIFPYAVCAVLARFDYSVFILPYISYEAYRRKSHKLFLLIPLMIATILVLFASFTLVFKVSAIYVILNFGGNKFYTLPFVGWIIGIAITDFFSAIFVSILLIVVILFFVTFSLDVLYRQTLKDLDLFSLCLMIPITFFWIPMTVSYTGVGRMISACPSVFGQHNKVETFTNLTIFSKNERAFLMTFGMVSFLMVYGYFI